MGFLQDYFESRRKFKQLEKVSRILGAGFEKLSATESLSFKNDIELAEDCLIDIIELDEGLTPVLDYYLVGPRALRRIYRKLCASGAAEWANGHWVPASALALALTLPFVLEETQSGDNEDDDVWTFLALDLVDYFKGCKDGPIIEFQDRIRTARRVTD
jgi:hypothetical protein